MQKKPHESSAVCEKCTIIRPRRTGCTSGFFFDGACPTQIAPCEEENVILPTKFMASPLRLMNLQYCFVLPTFEETLKSSFVPVGSIIDCLSSSCMHGSKAFRHGASITVRRKSRQSGSSSARLRCVAVSCGDCILMICQCCVWVGSTAGTLWRCMTRSSTLPSSWWHFQRSWRTAGCTETKTPSPPAVLSLR